MKLNDIELLKVSRVDSKGSYFMHEEREYFMPNDESMGDTYVGDNYLVMLINHDDYNVLILTEKIENYLLTTINADDLVKGDYVSGVILERTQKGLRVAINGKYTGLLHTTEESDILEIGQKIKLYVSKIREDGKIDLSLWKGGYKNFIDQTTDTIIKKLKENNGSLPYTDKTNPLIIQKELKMSKKKFKESIGKLYKQRKIIISDSGIKLNE